jgi:flagellar biogenesis protein FliO
MSGTEADTASYGDLLITALIVLVAACVAMFVLVRIAGRWLATGRTRGAGLLDVIARVPLEARRSLYIVEVAGKALLLGTSELGVTVLSELDGERVRAAPQPLTFVEQVRRAMTARRRPRHRNDDRDGDGDAGGASGASP